MRVLVRTDANPGIGMGHVMRCLSIADAFFARGLDVCFVLADDSVLKMVKDRGFEAIVLRSSFDDMEAELSLWDESLVDADIVLVDSYFATEGYLHGLKCRIRDGTKLVYVDDLASFAYPVDVLVNYNVYGSGIGYDALYRFSDVDMPKLILGVDYAPLREMFRGLPKKVQSKDVCDVLISTGGSDELHLSLALLEGLPGDDDRCYHFLIGAMNKDKDKICSLAVSDALKSRILVHENVSDMRGLISGMDLAVSAAGSTLYEICACGVPLITFSLADNQIPGGKAFSRVGLAEYLGDLRDLESVDSEKVISGVLRDGATRCIFEAVSKLDQDYEGRAAMGEKMQALVDGRGAERMVEAIIG